jgi:hypothetical protein
VRRPAARLAAAFAAGALAACGSSPRAPSCPGDRVGTLHFHGDPLLEGGCPFASDAGIDFTATLAYGASGTAVLCVDRPDAQALQGARDGGHVVVGTPAAPANVAACACAVTVEEKVDGDVSLDGGAAVAFAGALVDTVNAGAPGAACEHDAGTPCGAPCELRWTLTGTP